MLGGSGDGALDLRDIPKWGRQRERELEDKVCLAARDCPCYWVMREPMVVPLSHNYKVWVQRSQQSCRREVLHHRSPLTKAWGKTLYLPLTATSTDSSIQQLNWISSLDGGDSGRRRDCGKKRSRTWHSISFQPLFDSVLKRTSPSAEKRQQPVLASPARLAALMFKMAPVTNYRTEFPGVSATLIFFPHFATGACRGRTKGPPVLD